MISRQRTAKNAEWTSTFDPGVLAAGAVKQYQTESAELRPGINAVGFFNCITVINNSDADIGIEFDCNPDRRRRFPAHSAVPLTNMVPFQELNVLNLSTKAATAAGEVDVTVRYERDVFRGPI
jgi:hypothetical protein